LIRIEKQFNHFNNSLAIVSGDDKSCGQVGKRGVRGELS
jgi:hypothetical protein